LNKGLAVLFLGLTASNFDAGERHLRGEEGGNVEGGFINPTGAGVFRDVPPEPQDATEPFVPCSSQTVECTVTWKAGSAVCKG
jgi:hypothetical protein